MEGEKKEDPTFSINLLVPDKIGFKDKYHNGFDIQIKPIEKSSHHILSYYINIIEKREIMYIYQVIDQIVCPSVRCEISYTFCIWYGDLKYYKI